MKYTFEFYKTPRGVMFYPLDDKAKELCKVFNRTTLTLDQLEHQLKEGKEIELVQENCLPSYLMKYVKRDSLN